MVINSVYHTKCVYETERIRMNIPKKNIALINPREGCKMDAHVCGQPLSNTVALTIKILVIRISTTLRFSDFSDSNQYNIVVPDIFRKQIRQ